MRIYVPLVGVALPPRDPAVLPLPADIIDAIGLIADRRKGRFSNIEQLGANCHGGVGLEWLVGQWSAAKVHAQVTRQQGKSFE